MNRHIRANKIERVRQAKIANEAQHFDATSRRGATQLDKELAAFRRDLLGEQLDLLISLLKSTEVTVTFKL